MIQLIGYFLFTALILFIAKTYLDKKGHPKALFYLFFAEMWERFSYYGMRAILVIFLTGLITGDNPGWGWTSSEALSLLGTYAMFVYLTPLLEER